jgi:hypothetical protein
MAVPRFAQYLPKASPSIGGAIQQASGIAAQQANLELRKEQEARMAEQAKKGVGLERLIGPAAEMASQLELIKQLPEGSPERAMAEKNWKIAQNVKDSRSNFYNANVGLKNLPEAQKIQVINETQKKTQLPLSDVTKILSGDYSPLIGTESNENFVRNTPQHSKQEKAVWQTQLEQGQKILNRKVGDEGARKAIAPLMDMAKLINGIDMEPLSKFAGLKGKANYVAETALNAMGKPTSEDFKKKLIFDDVDKNILIDALRQVLLTSTQPSYIKEMIAPIMNPSTWRDSPETAIRKFNHAREYINSRLGIFTQLANEGIPVTQEMVDKIYGMKFDTPVQQTTSKKSSPEYSDENIRYTAQQEGISEEEVRRLLKEQGKL